MDVQAHTHQRCPLAYMTHTILPPHSSIVPEQLGQGSACHCSMQADSRGRDDLTAGTMPLRNSSRLPACLPAGLTLHSITSLEMQHQVCRTLICLSGDTRPHGIAPGQTALALCWYVYFGEITRKMLLLLLIQSVQDNWVPTVWIFLCICIFF